MRVAVISVAAALALVAAWTGLRSADEDDASAASDERAAAGPERASIVSPFAPPTAARAPAAEAGAEQAPTRAPLPQAPVARSPEPFDERIYTHGDGYADAVSEGDSALEADANEPSRQVDPRIRPLLEPAWAD